MPGYGDFGWGDSASGSTGSLGVGLDTTGVVYKDAIFIPINDSILVYSEDGPFLTTVPTKANTGWPTTIFSGPGQIAGGFAFNLDHTKLIVSAGDELHYYDVVLDTVLHFVYRGFYASLGSGFQCYWIQQGKPGDFICIGYSNIDNSLVKAAYVTNDGIVTVGPCTLFRPSYQLAEFMYLLEDNHNGPCPQAGVWSKSALSGDTQELYDGYTFIGAGPDPSTDNTRYLSSFTEVFRNGKVYTTIQINGPCGPDIGFVTETAVAELDAGGTSESARVLHDTDMAEEGSGVTLFCQSYLHDDRAYCFVNRPDGSLVPTLRKSSLPIDLDASIEIASTDIPTITPHCYKYPYSFENPPPPPPPNVYPGEARYPAINSSPTWGPPLP